MRARFWCLKHAAPQTHKYCQFNAQTELKPTNQWPSTVELLSVERYDWRRVLTHRDTTVVLIFRSSIGFTGEAYAPRPKAYA